jgi:hypothetical protein
MGGATLTGFTPSLALAQAPATFAATLDAALPVGLNPVSAQDAIHHYYGNELTGTWRATAIKETIVYGGREETDIENPVLSNDLGFLFSFDPEGRFIYSTWDVTARRMTSALATSPLARLNTRPAARPSPLRK